MTFYLVSKCASTWCNSKALELKLSGRMFESHLVHLQATLSNLEKLANLLHAEATVGNGRPYKLLPYH